MTVPNRVVGLVLLLNICKLRVLPKISTEGNNVSSQKITLISPLKIIDNLWYFLFSFIETLSKLQR